MRGCKNCIHKIEIWTFRDPLIRSKRFPTHANFLFHIQKELSYTVLFLQKSSWSDICRHIGEFYLNIKKKLVSFFHQISSKIFNLFKFIIIVFWCTGIRNYSAVFNGEVGLCFMLSCIIYVNTNLKITALWNFEHIAF